MSFGNREYDRQKPEIDFPDHAVPTELVIEDLIEGTGTEVVAGSTVSTHYVGVAFSTGEEFDSSWGRGAPLEFRAGIGQVIQGWDQGLLGMKVGGRRRLEIPSERRWIDWPERGPDLRRRPRRRPRLTPPHFGAPGFGPGHRCFNARVSGHRYPAVRRGK
jgi:peptidylprolyl isomerase